jgi:cold shock CspA family protein
MGSPGENGKIKLRATVISYDDARRFGFLAVEGRQSDLFVHKSELTRSGIPALVQGQAVKCRVGTHPQSGRECAVDLELGTA